MDPQWLGPPESIAALLETSDPATLIANIAAWLAEAIQHELSMGISLANIGATLSQWVGLGGSTYGLKGSELNFLGLQPLAAHCLKHVTIGQAAVEANTIARSTVIPSLLCQSNRDETAALTASNICGCNTPAIIEHNSTYFGGYYPNNMRAGVVYATQLNALMGSIASTPPPFTSPGASPAAALAPGENLAQTAANTAGEMPAAPAQAVQTAGQTLSTPANAMGQILQPVQQAISTVPQLANSVGQVPTQAFQTGTQSISGLMQTFTGGMFPGLANQGAAAMPGLAAAESVGLAGGVGSAGLGAGGGAGSLGVGYPGAGLTTFTRPASTFTPEIGGRPMGLKPGGLLNAAEVRGPTSTAPMGGAAMPVSPAAAGMLGREGAGADRDRVPHARIIVNDDKKNPR